MKWIVPQLSQQVFQIFCNKNISADGINIRISQNSDDAEQKSNGEMDLNDKLDLDIAEDQTGLRFQNINIPQGSIITKAYIQFTAANNNEEDSAGVDIFAENIANAKTFSQSKFNITNREKSNASIDWFIPKWNEKGDASKAQRTPDISALVQEVINREGWSSGNSIAFMLIINNNGDRDALTYDGNPSKSPFLHLEFSDKQTCDDLIHGKGFWENHPDYLSTILEISPIYLDDTTVKDVNQAISILQNASAKDAKDSLRAHLLTTILNLRNGADPKIAGSDINDVVKYTISFLVSYPEPVKSGHHDEDDDGNHDDRKEALELKDKLEDYNEKDNFSCPLTQHEIKLSESLEFSDFLKVDSSNSLCRVIVDFNGLSHGSNLNAINNYLESLDTDFSNDIKLSMKHYGKTLKNEVRIYDSDPPIGADPDLEVNIGNLAILPDKIGTPPMFEKLSDSPFGGRQIYEFDPPRDVNSFVFVDHDNKKAVATTNTNELTSLG